MNGFAIPLLGVIFVTLVSSSIQSIYADHLEPDQGIFSSEDEIEYITTEDSNYKIYLQAVLRNGDGQLISVVESTVYGTILPHKITDHVFDTLMGEKEIIIIDDVKYEKAEIIVTLDTKELMGNPSRTSHVVGLWIIHLCGESEFFAEHGYRCLPVFQANTNQVSIMIDDIVTAHWTILREMN